MFILFMRNNYIITNLTRSTYLTYLPHITLEIYNTRFKAYSISPLNSAFKH